MLKDDRRYFPHDAVPLARREMLLAHPEVKEALSGWPMSVADMRRMNRAVDASTRTQPLVVRVPGKRLEVSLLVTLRP
jgi:glycine betaine/choline ABC-type transport system substrate-binding protein